MRIIFPTDEHYPYQDEEARAIALKIASDFDPHIRIAGSDGIDFYSLSRFDKNPLRMKVGALQEDIDAWKKGQREWLDATPHANVKFLMGNHEDRLRRYLWKNPVLFGMDGLKIENLLNFDKLMIDVENGENAYNEFSMKGLVIRHGSVVRKFSAFTAKAEMEKEFHSVNVLTGHTHRGGSYYITGRNGVVQAHECFCLCSLFPEYVESPNWQQGIVLVEIDETVTVEAVTIHTKGGKKFARWRGKEYN